MSEQHVQLPAELGLSVVDEPLKVIFGGGFVAPSKALNRDFPAVRGHRPAKRPEAALSPDRISIPDDLEDRSLPKASGKVTMPRHIAWSFPYSYNLDNRKSLRSCYERVMTEGLDDDVRYYIDLDVLLEVWDELWLSPHVRDAWSLWLRARGLID